MGGENESGGEGLRAPHEAARQLRLLVSEYAQPLARLRGGWEPEAYRHAARQFGQMQALASGLPLLRTLWVEALITRFEFASVLWEHRTDRTASLRLHECHERHAAALRKLAEACAAYAARHEP